MSMLSEAVSFLMKPANALIIEPIAIAIMNHIEEVIKKDDPKLTQTLHKVLSELVSVLSKIAEDI